MNTRHAGGLVILITVLMGGVILSHAAQKTAKPVTKPLTMKKQPSPIPKTEPARKLPARKTAPQKQLISRLVVEDISLTDGFVTVTLTNKGPGSLSDDDCEHSTVTISSNGSTKQYALKDIDQGKRLIKPGGTVTYKSSIKLTSRHQVTVGITQAQGKHRLVRTLGKAPSHRMVQPEAKPPRKQIAHPPSREVAQKTPSLTDRDKPQPRTEPFISIEEISVKAGTIHITLKNTGTGRLSPQDSMKGRITLSMEGKVRSWSLHTMDPGGRLDRGDKTVVFDTGIATPTPKQVRVSLHQVKGEKVKVARVGEVKRSQTPMGRLKRLQESVQPVPRDLTTANKRSPLSPERTNMLRPQTLHPQFETQPIDPYQLTTLDFHIGNYPLSVKYHHHDSGRGWINIRYYTSDLSVYNGPVEFHIRVYKGFETLVDETFVDQSNADMSASFPFRWPNEYGMYLVCRVEVNPNHTIPEVHYENNHKKVELYINNGPVKFMVEHMIFPGTNYAVSDDRTLSFTEDAIKDKIENGPWWYYDPYDADCNMIMMNVQVWIGNPTCDEKTLPLVLSYDSYDGTRYVTHNVTLAPGRDKRVTMAVGLNLQRHNYIRVTFYDQGYHRIRVNFNFYGLPYDLE